MRLGYLRNAEMFWAYQAINLAFTLYLAVTLDTTECLERKDCLSES